MSPQSDEGRRAHSRKGRGAKDALKCISSHVERCGPGQWEEAGEVEFELYYDLKTLNMFHSEFLTSSVITLMSIPAL